MKQRDIVIDLETLDNVPSSVILSVGMACVDLHEGRVLDKMYLVFNREDQARLGRSVSPRALEWWEDQSDEARTVLEEAEQIGLGLREGLREVSRFVEQAGEDARIWGNGADFDVAILADAFSDVGMREPWHYWNIRCYRTFKNLFPYIEKPDINGVPHNALDDAVVQARHLQLLHQELQRCTSQSSASMAPLGAARTQSRSTSSAAAGATATG